MGKRIQVLFAIAGVLLAGLTSPGMTKTNNVRLWLGNVCNVPVRWIAPQTTSRKRRSIRNRRRANASPSDQPTTNGTRPQAITRQNSPQATLGPLSQVAYELPLRKPGQGEQQEQGLLTNVSCDAKGVTFNVVAGERMLKLWTPDLNKIHFATYTPEVSGDITCGARKPANKVVVIYRPSKEARAKFDGEPIAVEFVPKDFELKE